MFHERKDLETEKSQFPQIAYPQGANVVTWYDREQLLSAKIADWRRGADAIILETVMRRAAELPVKREVELFGDGTRASLRVSELICLLVGRERARIGEPFGYAEVIDFTLDHLEKPLAEGTLHKCFASLLEYKLIEAESHVRTTSAGRPRQLYTITANGRVALHLAASIASHLAESRSQVAA